MPKAWAAAAESIKGGPASFIRVSMKSAKCASCDRSSCSRSAPFQSFFTSRSWLAASARTRSSKRRRKSFRSVAALCRAIACTREHILRAMVHFPHQHTDLLLLPLAVGDVANDFRRPDYGSRTIADRRNRHGDVDQRSILSTSDGLIVFDPLARRDARENVVLFALPVGGDDAADGLPDHLRGRVAESTLS